MNDLEAKIARTMAKGRYLDDGLPSDSGMDRAAELAKREPILGGGSEPRFVDPRLENVFGRRQAADVAKQAEPDGSIRAQLGRILERTMERLFKSGRDVRAVPRRVAASRTASQAGRRPALKSVSFGENLAAMIASGHVPPRRSVQKSDPDFDRTLRRLVGRHAGPATIQKRDETTGEGRQVVIRT